MASRLLRRSDLFQKFKNLTQRRTYHHDHHMSPLEVDIAQRNTMDFLPKPKGSWKEMNDQRQRINNATLLIGVGVFLSSLIGTASLGFYDNMYFKPPYDKINKDFPGARFADAK